MKRMTLLVTILIVASMIISGCNANQTGSANATETATPAVTSEATAAADQVVVTLADNGQKVQLKVGESFLLKLGNEYTWQISLSNPDVIGLRKGVMVILGAQGIYDALQPGSVLLSATGDPPCRQSVPACAAPSILFSVTIEVSQ